ncbi:hypothetical protein B0J14DRAFT_562737 [Halenospora varia]|nr:hypothetical protein B0J14DRAFT_562737 [Halenospora varia]
MSTPAEKLHITWCVLKQMKEKEQLTGINFEDIAKEMGLPKKDAARMRWQRLMKEFKSGKLWDEAAIAASSTPKKKTASVATTPKKRKVEEGEGGGEVEMGGPVKTPKKGRGKKGEVKSEGMGEGFGGEGSEEEMYE